MSNPRDNTDVNYSFKLHKVPSPRNADFELEPVNLRPSRVQSTRSKGKMKRNRSKEVLSSYKGS